MSFFLYNAIPVFRYRHLKMTSAENGKCFVYTSSTDGLSAPSMPPNMTVSENASYTFASTTSFCLDFYFEV